MVYDAEKMNAILGSNLSTPTDQFPVALVSQDIEVFPDTVSGVYITYYAVPKSYDYGLYSSQYRIHGLKACN
jgi:hypothetical protein